MQPASEFRTLYYQQIETRSAREDTLPEIPAVYAWYRALELGGAVEAPERFLGHIQHLLSARLSETFVGKLGSLYHVSVHECAVGLSGRKWSLLERIAQHPDARTRLATILESAALLQAPLYVGKARNLRRRIGEHVEGRSGLADRLTAAGIPLSSCVLRYRATLDEDLHAFAKPTSNGSAPTPTEAEEGADEVTLLLEELLSRLSPSAFVRRIG
jgi:hypothetical protein